MAGLSTEPLDEQLLIERPRAADGARLWRIAKNSHKLDVNSPYAYLLWCRDFAETSVVARVCGQPVGFVTGYRRPAATDVAMVWQVAVDSAQRGNGLAGRMLDALFAGLVDDGVRYLETTITDDNPASIGLFSSFAKRWAARLEVRALFAESDFPDGHAAERLYRIGPLSAAPTRSNAPNGVPS